MSKKLIDCIYDKNSKKYYTPYNPYINMSKIKEYWEDGYTGQGIKIAVFDTGLMYDHPLLKNQIKDGVDFTGEGLEDQNGHGTICALILVMGAPDISIYNVKVLDDKMRGCEEDLLKGLIWAEKNKIDFVNLSLGRPVKEKCNIDECPICSQIKKMVTESNMIVCAAAGNDKNAIFCPTCSGYVISVGALDAKCQSVAKYSHDAYFYAPGTYGLKEI